MWEESGSIFPLFQPLNVTETFISNHLQFGMSDGDLFIFNQAVNLYSSTPSILHFIFSLTDDDFTKFSWVLVISQIKRGRKIKY